MIQADRLYIYLFLIVMLAGSACSSKEVIEKRPNILFIMLDDLGKEWISTYGAEGIETPTIDELARTGMRFENAYSMPQCTPTRATLLTGQYPWRNGWVNHYDVPRLGHGGRFDPIMNPSFGRMLRDAGYATCAAGKWQINDFRLEPQAMVNAGFDEYCMWTGGENGGSSTKASQLRYWDPYIHTKKGSKTYEGQFGEDIFSDFIIDFMRKNKENPMLIYYPMCLPHGPLTTTPAEKDAPKEEQHKAMVRYTDIILKKLISALEELKIRNNTIIVWTTDNGTGVGQIGRMNGRYVRGGKAHLSENGLNAPFIVNCPGLVPEGTVTEALIDFTDLLPTFCELAEAKLDKNFIYDGYSFAPLILGESTDSERDWIMGLGGRFAMLINDRITSAHTFRDRVIRDKRYKSYVDTTGRIYEIIDLLNDPSEQTNLIDSDHPEIVKSKEKFQAVVNQLPQKDNSPVYRQWDTSYYDHPAEALNKVSMRGKKGRAKSLPVTEEEYLERQKKN
ncbi:sulfatase-like hydrolase/transferase [Fulvivirgaceae bacterium BMA10]|uniref:Sulfatase-like hydrolase/transferase n=1 Tax=Splendidivirga corallicola TaxID=3051826 RepID=A0ABT8KVZ6_9BACT|nr:sulfatase-like hydrolase/transferase [Fulvivirgaceae bacterium BMA10]